MSLYDKLFNSKAEKTEEGKDAAVVSNVKVAQTTHATLTGSVDTADDEPLVGTELDKGFVEGIVEEDDASTGSFF